MNVFDKTKHLYLISGAPVPSVTQAIKAGGLINCAFFNDYACDRGTFVHDATVMLEAGTLDEEALDPVLRPYVEAYKAFLVSVRYEAILTEQDLYDAIHRFAGTPDRICKINGRVSILDIKTGGAQKWHELQTALYSVLAKKYAPQDRYSLYLTPSGTFKLHQHRNPSDAAAGLVLVSAYHIRAQYGGINEE